MRPFGLSVEDVNLVQLTLGAGRPLSYGELGFMNFHLTKKKTDTGLFKKRFERCLDNGLITVSDEHQLEEHPNARRYTISKRGRQALADVAIMKGGEYTYYKEYDGTTASRNKFMETKKVVVQGQDKEYTAQQMKEKMNEVMAMLKKKSQKKL